MALNFKNGIKLKSIGKMSGSYSGQVIFNLDDFVVGTDWSAQITSTGNLVTRTTVSQLW